MEVAPLWGVACDEEHFPIVDGAVGMWDSRRVDHGYRRLFGIFAWPALAQIAFLWNLFHSIYQGEFAPSNPWKSASLEWREDTVIWQR
jgi:hypothetical protein